MTMTISGTAGATFPDSTTQASAAVSFNGATVNALSSSAITLTSSSPQYQVAQITSVTNSVVNLPNATTMTKGTPPFVIENRSPIGANLSIANSAGTVVGYLPVGSIGLVSLQDSSTSAGVWAVSATTNQNAIFVLDGNSVTTPATSPSSYNAIGICGLSATSFVRYWWVTSAPLISTRAWTLYTQVCTISGSTITAGSTQNVTLHSISQADNTYDGQLTVERLSDTAFIVLAGAGTSYRDDVNANYYNIGNINVRVCTVSGTTVTFGTASGASIPQFNSGNYNPYNSAYEQIVYAVIKNGCVRRLSDTSFALVYNDGTTASYNYPYNYSGSMACQIVTVSGTTMTIGVKATVASSTYSQPQSLAALSSTALFVAYSQAASAGSASGRTKMNVISVSGTTATWGTSVNVESADSARIWEKDSSSNYAANAAVAPSSTSVIFTGGYCVAAASISGTTPTLLSIPVYNTSSSVSISHMQLATSTRTFAQYNNGNRSYFDINAYGFAQYNNYSLVLPVTVGITSWPYSSALGAQPTTAFISTNNTNVILGSTT